MDAGNLFLYIGRVFFITSAAKIRRTAAVKRIFLQCGLSNECFKNCEWKRKWSRGTVECTSVSKRIYGSSPMTNFRSFTGLKVLGNEKWSGFKSGINRKILIHRIFNTIFYQFQGPQLFRQQKTDFSVLCTKSHGFFMWRFWNKMCSAMLTCSFMFWTVNQYTCVPRTRVSVHIRTKTGALD